MWVPDLDGIIGWNPAAWIYCRETLRSINVGGFVDQRSLSAFQNDFASSYLPYLTCSDLIIASYAWFGSLNGLSVHRKAHNAQTNGQPWMPRTRIELEVFSRRNTACAFNCSEAVHLEWVFVSVSTPCLMKLKRNYSFSTFDSNSFVSQLFPDIFDIFCMHIAIYSGFVVHVILILLLGEHKNCLSKRFPTQ